MGIFDAPDPISWYEGAKNSGLERKEIDAFVSSQYSGLISFMWRLGARNLLGLGPALRDYATSVYLTLQKKETKNFLTLTVHKELLDPNNLSQFQTEETK